MLFTVTTIICFEEVYGPYHAPQLPIVMLANLPWLLFPIIITYRMWKSPHPFTAVSSLDTERRLEAARSAPAEA